MEQMELNSAPKYTKLDSFSKEEIIQKYSVIEDELARVVRELYLLKGQKLSDEQLRFILAEQVKSLTDTVYGKKSERYKKPVKSSDDDDEPKDPKVDRVKQLSQRYPNIFINEQFVELEPIPSCPCCSETMIDSDMFEVSEQLSKSSTYPVWGLDFEIFCWSEGGATLMKFLHQSVEIFSGWDAIHFARFHQRK